MKYKIEDISHTITEHCPGPCRYCSIWKLKDNRDKELTKEEIDSIFSSENFNLKKVHITGGEPHLSETYFRIVESLYNFYSDVVIDSPITGWFPERHEEIARYVLAKIPVYRLVVSFDGDRETYSKIRLHKDGYDKALETIERFKKIKGIDVRIQFTIYKENYSLIEWAYNFAKKMEIGLYIGYGRFNPQRFKNTKDNLTGETLNKDSFVWSADELKEIDRQLQAIGYDKGRYRSKYILQKAFYENIKVDFNCYMGKRNIDIDPYGNVYPCLLWLDYLKMGNIREEGSLDNVLKSDKAIRVIDMIEKKICQEDCLYTCANKLEIIEPYIPSVGLIPYKGKYGYIFSDLDVIPIKPWWYNEYAEKGILS